MAGGQARRGVRWLGVAGVLAAVVPGCAAEPVARPRFEDYPIAPGELFDGKPAAVDLASHPEARTWRTSLREGAARGPDFAGRWTVVPLGCGPECQRIALVDAASGRVWLAPWVANLGVEHRLESRLLVVNPEAQAQAAVEHGGAPGRYVTRWYAWSGDSLALLDSMTWTPPPAAGGG
jgi:hypothetical protein